AASLGVAPARAAGRPPDLERFVARFNASSTTTFYIATAGDPDGGKLTYQWSLRADCGQLVEPDSTGPSNGFQFGPPAKRPDGCSIQEQSRAIVSVRIVDAEACAIVYTQRARDETEHVRPSVRTEPCPPRPPGEGGGFPAGLVVAALILGAGAWMFSKMKGRAPASETTPWEAPETAGPHSVASTEPEHTSVWDSAAVPPPAPVATVPADADEPLASLSLGSAPGRPCRDGEVRGEGSDLVAHDTVLSGAVRATAGERTIEIPPHDAQEIMRLAADIPPDRPLEVEVEVPLRLVTVVSSRRETCREGRWVPDVRNATHDGPGRTERLRAIVATPDELARFANEILARRLRTLADSRRRLEAALATTRGAVPGSTAGRLGE
ncbi:MAG: hypothetical protein ACRDJM_08585, partial [Actinomycetota bacterium]